MPRITAISRRAAAFTLAAIFVPAMVAAEPIQGRWLLVSQEVAGNKTPVAEQLTLRVNPSGPALEFAYSTPVNDIQFVSLRFAARTDGSAADVTDSNGKKIGSVKVTRTGASQYRIVLEGQNRPTANGSMTVSPDGKTLTSQSDSKAPGRGDTIHTVQVFARQ